MTEATLGHGRGDRGTERLVRLTKTLGERAEAVGRGAAAYVYNPLEYAWHVHETYLRRYGTPPKEVLFVGMNPGPFGMAQTGVPFGDPVLAAGFLGLSGQVGRPPREHPKRPVLGFQSRRREVSGKRFWGWVEDRFGTPRAFFARNFVWNYCPLLFLTESGRNETPDKLARPVREQLFAVCDEALVQVCGLLGVEVVVAVGRFAETRARTACGSSVRIVTIQHPSPANPHANKGWAEGVDRALESAGIHVPRPAARPDRS